jgi:hypothetical protein
VSTQLLSGQLGGLYENDPIVAASYEAPTITTGAGDSTGTDVLAASDKGSGMGTGTIPGYSRSRRDSSDSQLIRAMTSSHTNHTTGNHTNDNNNNNNISQLPGGLRSLQAWRNELVDACIVRKLKKSANVLIEGILGEDRSQIYRIC